MCGLTWVRILYIKHYKEVILHQAMYVLALIVLSGFSCSINSGGIDSGLARTYFQQKYARHAVILGCFSVKGEWISLYVTVCGNSNTWESIYVLLFEN